MPTSTCGAETEFGVELTGGDEDFEETKYITIAISEECFEIATGGSVYEKGVGSDSITGPGYVVELDGYERRTLARLRAAPASV
jgi:hypothetical protein